MKVAFSEDAQGDLRGLFLHLHARNPAAARKILWRIEHRCLSLAEFPNRGPQLEVRNGRELRRVFEQPFVIVYEKGRGLITTYRVFHGARDGQALLDGLTVSESDT